MPEGSFDKFSLIGRGAQADSHPDDAGRQNHGLGFAKMCELFGHHQRIGQDKQTKRKVTYWRRRQIKSGNHREDVMNGIVLITLC